MGISGACKWISIFGILKGIFGSFLRRYSFETFKSFYVMNLPVGLLQKLKVRECQKTSVIWIEVKHSEAIFNRHISISEQGKEGHCLNLGFSCSFYADSDCQTRLWLKSFCSRHFLLFKALQDYLPIELTDIFRAKAACQIAFDVCQISHI